MISYFTYGLSLIVVAGAFVALGCYTQRGWLKKHIEKYLGDPLYPAKVGSLSFYAVPNTAEVRKFDSAIRYKIPLKRKRKRKVEPAVDEPAENPQAVDDVPDNSLPEAEEPMATQERVPTYPED
jgi:hypothetical protein